MSKRKEGNGIIFLVSLPSCQARHRLHKPRIPLLPTRPFHLQFCPATAPKSPPSPLPSITHQKQLDLPVSRSAAAPLDSFLSSTPGVGGRGREGKKVYPERALKSLKKRNPRFGPGESLESEAAANPQATTRLSDSPMQLPFFPYPMAGHLILRNRRRCQLPSRRNACHSRAERARAKLRKGRRQPAPLQPLSCIIQIINTPRSFVTSNLVRREESCRRGEGETGALCLRVGLQKPSVTIQGGVSPPRPD